MIKIELAHASQLDVLSELFDQYRIFYSMNSDLSAAKKFITERLHLNDSLIYLAKSKDEYVGFAQIYKSFSSVAMKQVWILNDLYIHEKFRQQGCAKKLLTHIRLEAKKNDVFSIRLSTATDNFNAKNLYQSLGYQIIDSFDYYSIKIG